MLNHKSLQSVAEAVKKVWAEELTDKQKKIDKNHNGKIDGQDLSSLRKEGWDDMVKSAKDTLKDKPKPNGGAGVKQGTAYGGGKQKDDKPVKEEASQEEFTAELKKAQAKAAAKAKQPEVAKPAVQAVQNEEVETVDEAAFWGQDKLAKKLKQNSAGGTSTVVDSNGKGGTKTTTTKVTKEPEGLYSKKRFETDSQRIARLAKEKRQAAKNVNEETHTEIQVIDLTDANGVKMSTIELDERHLSSDEKSEVEKNVKCMKKNLQGFKDRYGDRAKEVMYATATKQAKGE